ncbi:hypothetical protein SODALDRAFT_308628 [Sodiomyces alkalinus F11]|uniref:C6 zinc finger domain-containing protein n=1 Tax=Sodiomyces alkalinus (strain CBS 110278 / VKM F-3762 / F11) TaxID=1314773 RepID=A0A3N2Q4R0_SODAK|nr:hypothetical protein SODALDRAFT_308628 [Sodiomyces alkalinus F11]ROT41687.1 hypothetical protein SODALDRAFT_308628 [Sodiomyces alkalinus F11]
MNCVRTRGICEGYVIKPRKPRSKPGRKQPSTADDATLVHSQQSRRAKSPTVIMLEPDLNSTDFADDLSVMYFDEFLQFLRVSLSSRGALNSKLWKTTMPQMTRTNTTLRHAAMAIGALSRAFGSAGDGSDVKADELVHLARLERSPHYNNAVVHYCRALRLQSQAPDGLVLQDTIFLSVLFIAFEVMRGDQRSALRHINHGMALFFSILMGGGVGDKHPLTSLAAAPRALLGEVAEIYSLLGSQSRTVLDGRVGGSLPLQEVTTGLMRKGQSLEMLNLYMMQLPRSLASIDSIPKVFADVGVAEEYWAAIQRRGAQLGPLVMDLVYESGILESEDDDEVDALFADFLRNQTLMEFCDESARLAEEWDAAFQPLYMQALMEGKQDREKYMQALQLRLSHLLVQAFGCLVQYTDHEAMATLTPLCREIVSVAEVILRTSQEEFTSAAHRTGVDGGVTWPLGLVSLHCRDPLVREEAIRVLRQYPRRDGLWDTRLFAAVAERNRDLERANAVEGTGEEQWRRLWRREHVFEEAGSRIVFRFLEKDEISGQWLVVEEAADLTADLEVVGWKRQPLTGKGRFLLSNILPVNGSSTRSNNAA